MDGALWGGREHRKGHMCLGRLEQSEVSNYHFPDYFWQLIAEFVIDEQGYNKMSDDMDLMTMFKNHKKHHKSLTLT